MTNSLWLLFSGAWLLTYAMHSTLLLGGVWLITRSARIRSDALREALWKVALVGGVITATLQLSLGIEPLAGQFSLLRHGDDATLAARHEEPVAPGEMHPDSLLMHSNENRGEMASMPLWRLEKLSDFRHEGRPAVAALPGGLEDEAHESRTSGLAYDGHPSRASSQAAWPWILLAICLFTALSSLALLSWTWIRLKSFLRGRCLLKEGPLPELLARLCARAGMKKKIRLTCSKQASTPMALGILRPEICLPVRALTGLSPREQESMLAHELAHLARHDPFWLCLHRVLESIFFFQPLNRIGRRCWQETVEYRCDAWAARLLGNGFSLARCLTEVADWIVEPAPRGFGQAVVHGMAQNRSKLARRVKRLIESPPTPGKGKGPWWILSASALLLVMTHAIPGVSVTAAPGRVREIEINSPLQPAGKEFTPAFQNLVVSFTALNEELNSLDHEVRVLKQLLEEAGLSHEVGDLLESAEARIASLHEKREKIKALIRRVAQPEDSKFKEETTGLRRSSW